MNTPARRPAAQPGWFGPPGMPLFGWLHATEFSPEPVAPALGVVICSPLGQEMVNSYRTVQAIADALAGQGMPCLRFCYAGCGDSGDPQEAAEGGALPAWQASIDAACDYLKTQTGVRRLVLVALRAGVLFSAPLAARRADVIAMAALAPCVSGRAVVREWRAHAALASLKEDRGDGSLDVFGDNYSAASLQAVTRLSLEGLDWPPTKPVLVADQLALPAAARWCEQLQRKGTTLSQLHVDNWADMLAEPHLHVVPTVLIDQVAEWARRLPLHTEEALGGVAALTAQDAQDGIPRSATADITPSVLESVWWLDDAQAKLFGVLTLPRNPGPDGTVWVLPNTGAVHRIGGHRLYVQLARRLAAQGHCVLRLDLSGLGDSPFRCGAAPDVVYGRHAVDDLALAVQAVQRRWPLRSVVLLGLCAGAYHALRLVVRQAGVAQCVVVNPLVYHWHEHMRLEDHETTVQAAYYRAKWLKRESWARLLSGRSDLRQLGQVVADWPRRQLEKALTGLRSRAARAARGEPATDDLARDLRDAATHTGRLSFVFSADEPGWPALQAQASPVLTRLIAEGRAEVHHIENADHTFSTAASRERFVEWVALQASRQADRQAGRQAGRLPPPT